MSAFKILPLLYIYYGVIFKYLFIYILLYPKMYLTAFNIYLAFIDNDLKKYYHFKSLFMFNI